MSFDLQPQLKKKLGTLCKKQNKNKIPNLVKSYLAEKKHIDNISNVENVKFYYFMGIVSTF